jgi:intracellular septation protein A
MSFYSIYYHNWARFLVLGILPISVISFLNTKIYLAVRLVSYSTIYYHNWDSFLVLGILPISVISFLNTKIYLAVRLVCHSTASVTTTGPASSYLASYPSPSSPSSTPRSTWLSGYSVTLLNYHNWACFLGLCILPITIIFFLHTKIYLAVRLVSYSTIYFHNWACFLVLGILPISVISFL